MKTLACMITVNRPRGTLTSGREPYPFSRHFALSSLFVLTVLLAGCPELTVAEQPTAYDNLDAHEAVREGNRLLLQGDAEAALRAYEQAERIAPDRLEVPFVKGIGNYNLKQFEDARKAFERALLSKDRKLAADAQYGIGAAHHAEALALLGATASGVTPPDAAGPQDALRHLESAMQNYRRVLMDHPRHAAAREADTKAAHLWRQVRQQLQEQQQQQQNQKCDNPKEDEQDKDNQEQQEHSDQNEQQQEQNAENQQDQSEHNEQQNQSQSQEQKEAQEQPSEEQPQPEESNDEKQEEPQAAKPQQEERESHEQANRRLREMLQAIRDRQKIRREKIEPVTIAPVDKDW